MHNVEDFVSELSKEECRGEYGEHCKSGHDGDDLGCFEEVLELFAFCPGIDVYDGMEDRPEYCAVSGYLVEDVEALIGVGHEEGEGRVLQGEKGHER